MFKKLTYVVICLFVVQLSAQKMTNKKIETIIAKESDSILSKTSSNFQFIVKDRLLICMTDSVANRMRIITPIAKLGELKTEHITGALAANFHSALDVRYAVSDGVMWAAFIHPLEQLSEGEMVSAIYQTYNAALNFGTTYQSTGLFFNPSLLKEEEADLKSL